MDDEKMIEGYLVEFKKQVTPCGCFEDYTQWSKSIRSTTYHTITVRAPNTGGQDERIHHFFIPNNLPVAFMDIIQAEVNYQLRRMLEEDRKREYARREHEKGEGRP